MTVVSYDGPRRHMTAVSYMDADGRHVVARAARAEFTEFTGVETAQHNITGIGGPSYDTADI